MYKLNKVSDISNIPMEEKGGDPLISLCREMLHRVNREEHKQFWGEMLKDLTSSAESSEQLYETSMLQPMEIKSAIVMFDKYSCPKSARYVKITCPNKNTMTFPIGVKYEKTYEGKEVELYLIPDPKDSSIPMTYGALYKALGLKNICSLNVVFLS